ncbi:type II toxin-antitoxin system RelE/ParE family toxin [Bradyrhizobium sp.]|uniref:type II toxin-antitoxin system RelE/ParE family toxin n=1 Tax=Bradyrhizobium sp. TaxID=376 RepID=UPI0025BA062F|nr:type II toxin-antitoxin system RelE/ParE family toxin [Bradyrhizobium sp.]
MQAEAPPWIWRICFGERTRRMTECESPVVWSPEALDDINHVWDYYANVAGRTSADKILRDIAKVVAMLRDFPRAGRARDEIRNGLRSLSINTQIVFYRLKDDRPQIVRVLDGRQDLDEVFSEG